MKYITGNLLDAHTQALVNTVNTVGIMGKGIALQFKERFPANFKIYQQACKEGEVEIGKMLVVKENTLQGEYLIINFPTKKEWFKKSQYSFIEEGLKDLAKKIIDYKIKSIAIPPLGCGNGGLKWNKVKDLITQYLGNLEEVDIQIFEPNNKVKEVLQKENSKKPVELTPARAMLLYALFRLEKFGETATVFAANKLAYFLQQSGENLKLQFVPYTYGPYSHAVEKVLYALNGKYLKGLEQMDAKPFEPILLNWDLYNEVEVFVNTKLDPAQKERLNNVFKFIDGFETTFSLEILSSTHYLLDKYPKDSINEIYSKIQDWNDRKRILIKKEHVCIAFDHLNNYKNRLFV